MIDLGNIERRATPGEMTYLYIGSAIALCQTGKDEKGWTGTEQEIEEVHQKLLIYFNKPKQVFGQAELALQSACNNARYVVFGIS